MNTGTGAVLACAAAAVLLGCAGIPQGPLSAAVPVDTTPFEPPPPPAPSRVQMEVRVTVAELNRIFDARLPAELVRIEDQSVGLGTTASARIVRDGPTSLSTADGGFSWTVPVRIEDGSMHVEWTREIPLGFGRSKTLSFSRDVPFSGALAVTGRTKVSVDGDWNLHSETTTDFRWTDDLRVEVDVEVRSFSFDVSGIADRALRARMAEMGAQVDAEIANKADIRSMVERAWGRLGDPVQLHRKPAVWMSGALQTVALPDPEIGEDAVILRPTVTGLVSVHVGPAPARRDPGPLPALSRDAGRGRGIFMTVPIIVPWEEMRRITMERAGGREMELADGCRVTIHDISFSRDGDRIRVMVDLNSEKRSGLYVNLDGRVTLTGRPEFDRSSFVVSMEDLSFDLQTANIMASLADWVAHDAFLGHMKTHMTVDVDEHLRNVRDMVNGGLKDVRYGDLVTLNGRVVGIEPTAPVVRPDGLEMRFRVAAEASVEVK